MQRLFGVQLSLRRNTLLMSGGLLLCTHTSTTDPLLLLLAPIRAGPCSPPPPPPTLLLLLGSSLITGVAQTGGRRGERWSHLPARMRGMVGGGEWSRGLGVWGGLIRPSHPANNFCQVPGGSLMSPTDTAEGEIPAPAH